MHVWTTVWWFSKKSRVHFLYWWATGPAGVAWGPNINQRVWMPLIWLLLQDSWALSLIFPAWPCECLWVSRKLSTVRCGWPNSWWHGHWLDLFINTRKQENRRFYTRTHHKWHNFMIYLVECLERRVRWGWLEVWLASCSYGRCLATRSGDRRQAGT